MSDALSKIFNVEPVEVITHDNQSVTIPPEGAEDVDYEYARANTYQLAQQGTEAMGVAMRVVREAESPAAITALSGLIKTMSELNKTLILLNKDKADAKNAKVGQKPTVGTAVNHQTNIVFSGSSSDLSKLIKETINNNNQ